MVDFFTLPSGGNVIALGRALNHSSETIFPGVPGNPSGPWRIPGGILGGHVHALYLRRYGTARTVH